jgi:hypothetical protein
MWPQQQAWGEQGMDPHSPGTWRTVLSYWVVWALCAAVVFMMLD